MSSMVSAFLSPAPTAHARSPESLARYPLSRKPRNDPYPPSDGEANRRGSAIHQAYSSTGRRPGVHLTGNVDQQHHVVGKGSQLITFTSSPPSTATVGGPTYTVAATGGASGNPVTFTIDAASSSVCSLSGSTSTVSFAGPGTCTIDADQAGNSNYDAAPQMQQSFAVGKGSQAITFTSTAPSSATVGGPTYTVTAAASSGLPVSFSSATPSSRRGGREPAAAVGLGEQRRLDADAGSRGGQPGARRRRAMPGPDVAAAEPAAAHRSAWPAASEPMRHRRVPDPATGPGRAHAAGRASGLHVPPAALPPAKQPERDGEDLARGATRSPASPPRKRRNLRSARPSPSASTSARK
jgi:hypothetical protein